MAGSDRRWWLILPCSGILVLWFWMVVRPVLGPHVARLIACGDAALFRRLPATRIDLVHGMRSRTQAWGGSHWSLAEEIVWHQAHGYAGPPTAHDTWYGEYEDRFGQHASVQIAVEHGGTFLHYELPTEAVPALPMAPAPTGVLPGTAPFSLRGIGYAGLVPPAFCQMWEDVDAGRLKAADALAQARDPDPVRALYGLAALRLLESPAEYATALSLLAADGRTITYYPGGCCCYTATVADAVVDVRLWRIDRTQMAESVRAARRDRVD